MPSTRTHLTLDYRTALNDAAAGRVDARSGARRGDFHGAATYWYWFSTGVPAPGS